MSCRYVHFDLSSITIKWLCVEHFSWNIFSPVWKFLDFLELLPIERVCRRDSLTRGTPMIVLYVDTDHMMCAVPLPKKRKKKVVINENFILVARYLMGPEWNSTGVVTSMILLVIPNLVSISLGVSLCGTSKIAFFVYLRRTAVNNVYRAAEPTRYHVE